MGYPYQVLITPHLIQYSIFPLNLAQLFFYKLSRNHIYFHFYLIALFLMHLYIIPASGQQENKTDPRDAEDMFSAYNYEGAIKLFTKLLEEKPEDIYYHYKLGLCFLSADDDKSQAIPYFEWIMKQPNFDNEYRYWMGKTYHYTYRFDDAISAFNSYKSYAVKAADKEKADKEIEECNNGKELVKHPVDITFENIGKPINTPYPDYYPLVSGDEKVMIYTSRRKMYAGGGELSSAEIYISKASYGRWQKPRSMGAQINTSNDEDATWMNSEANEMVLYMENVKGKGALYHCERAKSTWLRPVRYNDNVNEGKTTSGCLSPDGNMLFFASERAGGMGGSDIYISKKLPNGEWGTPQNAGQEINTPYKEDFPDMDKDGITLYFASEGHNSMGDYDLFKSRWLNKDSNIWTPCENLGYPINTTFDDRSISFTSDHRAAYISRYRPEGYGDLDIYRVVFNSVKRYAVIHGKIIVDKGNSVNAKITALNHDAKDSLFNFKPLKRNGHYVMVLLPGTYELKIECNNYAPITDKITIFDIGEIKTDIEKDYSFVTEAPVNNEKPKPKPHHSIH